MAKYKFTEEQMEMLRLNPYTFSVTPDMIRFTKEFKEEFWKKYQEGYSTRKILKDLGYDPEMIGKSTLYLSEISIEYHWGRFRMALYANTNHWGWL